MLKHTQQHKKNARSVNPGHLNTTNKQTNYEDNSLLSFFFEIKSITTLTASLINGAR